MTRRSRHHSRGLRRLRHDLHVGLRPQPRLAGEALREGQDLAVERDAPTSTGRSTSTPRRSAGSSAAAVPPRFQALQDAEDSPVKHFGEKEWRQVSVEIQNSLLSQFMHGEQGALLCTARIVETVPWIDAKYYAATQVMDEARHVEVFAALPRREARQPVRHQRQPEGHPRRHPRATRAGTSRTSACRSWSRVSRSPRSACCTSSRPNRC